MPKLQFVFIVHNHQPIGNFESVFESAYRDAYEPFLRVVTKFPRIAVGMHLSGCLLEWLETAHPDYVSSLREMVQQGRFEILGGGFYEPILTMLPPRDRVSQIKSYADYLEKVFGARPKGVWIAERVWEQSLVSDLVAAGAEFVVLDDFHFLKAGLETEELTGPFTTEDEGHVMRAVPVDEQTRYDIPFHSVKQAIEHLREIHEKRPDSVVVFADDGEKFGSWPGTQQMVYGEGWLEQFFTAIADNHEWIETVLPSNAALERPAVASVYLPDGSYREMTEWVLPPDRYIEFDGIRQELVRTERGRRVAKYLKAGFWRNFKVRYPESNELYARMMEQSARLHRIEQASQNRAEETVHTNQANIQAARQALHRGQCNCAYWHGSFGGVYLPHLRNGVFAELIETDNLLTKVEQGNSPFVEASEADFDFDGRPEARLANGHLVAYFAPAKGGMLYELDVRQKRVNLQAGFSRKLEPYHQSLLRSDQPLAGIHEAIEFDSAKLTGHLGYDRYPRRSLIEHFLPPGQTVESYRNANHLGPGPFQLPAFASQIEQTPHGTSLRMSRTGLAHGRVFHLSKRIDLRRDQQGFTVEYDLEETSTTATSINPLEFAVEFCFAAMAGGCDDRYYATLGASPRKLGNLSSEHSLESLDGISLVDEWLGLAVDLRFSEPASLLIGPVCTVSRCEAGFELVHQSACVVPRWPWNIGASVAEGGGRQQITIELNLRFL